jgi:hypothetical protein
VWLLLLHVEYRCPAEGKKRKGRKEERKKGREGGREGGRKGYLPPCWVS